MLLSLKEGQSKKLAQVISNETSRQILDYLTKEDFATESQIAKDLKIPLSTAHYNMKALKESGLVVDDEYHYSEKGKEVPHYKLAKKFIIIAPRDEEKIMDKIKKFLPVGAITLAATAIIHWGRQLFTRGGEIVATQTLSATNDMVIMDYAQEKAAARIAPMAAEGFASNTSMIPPQMPVETVSQTPVALWFLAGAVFALICVFVWEMFRKK